MEGTIKKIIAHRGFGFISVEGEEDDIFFHRSQVGGSLDFDNLTEGTVVSFELEDTMKGPQAVSITAA